MTSLKVDYQFNPAGLINPLDIFYHMTYIDELNKQVKEIFDSAQDKSDLFDTVLDFVQAKSKESFKNGLETARKRQAKPKGQWAKKS